jgi:ParB/RepB/Spo0J family partition protein
MKLREIRLSEILEGRNIRSTTDDELGGLIDSIERFDLLQPIIVTPKGAKFEVVAGHRRLAAMKARNESTIPCMVRDDLPPSDLLLIKLVENVQRKQMKPVEYVRVFNEMKRAQPTLTHTAIAKMLGKTPEWISLKYRADKTYNELLERGIEDGVAEELTENDLIMISRVRDRRERMRAARRVAGGDRLAPQRAKSYILQQATKYRGAGIDENVVRAAGFRVVDDPKTLNLIIICRTRDAQKAVIEALAGLQAARAKPGAA